MTTGNVPLRRSGRHRTGSVLTQNSPPSTSEYHGSERSVMDDNHSLPEPDHPNTQEQWGRSLRGRKVKQNNYKESGSEDDMHLGLNLPEDHFVNGKADLDQGDEDDDDDEGQPRRSVRSRKSRTIQPSTRSTHSATVPPRRLTRATSRANTKSDEVYVDHPSEESDDADGSLEDAPHTSSDLDADLDADAEGEPDFDADGEPDIEVQDDGRPYSLRQRAKINYAIPPPIEETKPPPKSKPANRGGARTRRGPGWSATGAELSRWMGMPADDSVGSPMSRRGV